ncbi:transposase [Desulfovibrio sulfodismutans]|uniref:Transposase n=1 Tax=Desulfolutivibrio sulfodismutans TaxID=63561 RepID=A0A7K3NI49_9BACT|nr:transposase [Desulfolutivibrio sulfodismutans]QLA12881.1 transposase [Desulfolutivibrio sulfodismutans DSM 3696]
MCPKTSLLRYFNTDQGPHFTSQEFSQARQAIGNWVRFYNEQRPHTVFDGRRRPMDVFKEGQSASKAA